MGAAPKPAPVRTEATLPLPLLQPRSVSPPWQDWMVEQKYFQKYFAGKVMEALVLLFFLERQLYAPPQNKSDGLTTTQSGSYSH